MLDDLHPFENEIPQLQQTRVSQLPAHMYLDNQPFSIELAMLYAPIAILVVAQDGLVIYSNHQARYILGCDDTAAMNIDDLLQANLLVGKVRTSWSLLKTRSLYSPYWLN